MIAAGVAGALAQDAPTLYSCANEAAGQTGGLGVMLCDAAPTAELTARAAADNLQERQGALVVKLEPDSVADAAGFHAGDVIYRVGGVDVTGAADAAENLAQVQPRSDTVVNFLRGGRPYRIKLRRE